MNPSSTPPQKPEIKYTYEFRFIPRLPTKIAWDTKEFNDFSDPKMLFRAMRSNEYKNETPYSGQILFKKGFFSERINPKTLDKYGKPKKPYTIRVGGRKGVRRVSKAVVEPCLQDALLQTRRPQK